MSLIQIPKIEYITLEQFIPNWTEMIEEMDEKGIKSKDFARSSYASQKGLNYSSHRFCLVGEGHKNNDDYIMNGCSYCCHAALLPASSALYKGKETFQAFKLDLFTHMLEAHPQLMIK